MSCDFSHKTFLTGLNLDLLKMDTYKMDMEKDPLFRGEFDVVKQLVDERPEMVAAKKRVSWLHFFFLFGRHSTGPFPFVPFHSSGPFLRAHLTEPFIRFLAH